MLNRNTKVRPLTEELAEIEIDPKKFLGDIDRSSKLVEARMGGNAGGGAPSYLRRVPEPAAPAAEPEVRTDQQEDDAGDGEGLSISEAMKIVRQRRLTSSEKAKGRRKRRKVRSKRKAQGKTYRRRMRRRISRVGKMKRRRYGAAGLAKLHKARRKIVMSDNKALANLREDLNQTGSESAKASSVYEDAAYQSGLLAMHLGEMFEALGDEQSAETMFDVSDAAADLSERLVGVEAEGDLNEADGDMLQRVLDSIVKGLRMYEAMGSPSLGEVIEFVEANGKKKDDEEDDDAGEGDDEGDDDDEEEDDE